MLDQTIQEMGVASDRDKPQGSFDVRENRKPEGKEVPGKKEFGQTDKAEKEEKRWEDTPSELLVAVAEIQQEVIVIVEDADDQVLSKAVAAVQAASETQPVLPEAPLAEQADAQVAPQPDQQGIIESVSVQIQSDSSAPALPLPILLDPVEEQQRFDNRIAQATEELQAVLPGDEGDLQVEEEPELPLIVEREEPLIDVEEDEGGDLTIPPAAEKVESKEEGPFRRAWPQLNLNREAQADSLKERVRRAGEAVQSLFGDTPDAERIAARSTAAQPFQQRVVLQEQTEQVRVQIIENLEQNRTEFQMHLRPAELGRVDVKMVMESGRLAVEIVAASPKAVELLAKQAESLAAALRTNGLQVDSVQVVSQSESASGQMRGAFDMDQSGRNEHQQEQDGERKNSRPEWPEEDDAPNAIPELMLDYEV